MAHQQYQTSAEVTKAGYIRQHYGLDTPTRSDMVQVATDCIRTGDLSIEYDEGHLKESFKTRKLPVEKLRPKVVEAAKTAFLHVLFDLEDFTGFIFAFAYERDVSMPNLKTNGKMLRSICSYPSHPKDPPVSRGLGDHIVTNFERHWAMKDYMRRYRARETSQSPKIEEGDKKIFLDLLEQAWADWDNKRFKMTLHSFDQESKLLVEKDGFVLLMQHRRHKTLPHTEPTTLKLGALSTLLKRLEKAMNEGLVTLHRTFGKIPPVDNIYSSRPEVPMSDLVFAFTSRSKALRYTEPGAQRTDDRWADLCHLEPPNLGFVTNTEIDNYVMEHRKPWIDWDDIHQVKDCYKQAEF